MIVDDIDTIINLYNDGKSLAAIGTLYGKGRHTIARLLKKHDVPIRSDYKDRHPNKKPKYKSPYKRGMNPNSHGSVASRKSSALYIHRQRKYRYRTRVFPRQCTFIRKTGDRCLKYALPGACICFHHGGRLILRQANGLNSKVLKRNILHAIIHANRNKDPMLFLNELTPDEVTAVNSTDYSKLKILNAQHKLSDVLLSRSLTFLNELESKLNHLNAEIEAINNGQPASQSMQGLLITQSTLLKNIVATHTVISKHQETVGKLLTTQEQILTSGSLKTSLNDLQLEVSKDSMSILLDLIESYRSAGAFESLEELQTYLPEAVDVIHYELLDD